MFLEVLWVDETYRVLGYGRELVLKARARRRGYGSKLMLKAEEIAKENGCIVGQTWVLSFQAPEFFERIGYESFGMSDGFPKGIKEHYFKKRF